MSVLILGGNECMERRYKDVCSEYSCDATVYTKFTGGKLNGSFGTPDLCIMFTGELSHKMKNHVMNRIKDSGAMVEYCRNGSVSSLRNVLDRHVERQ